MTESDRLLTRLAALDDPVRRTLYRFVVARGCETSRDQAARGVRVSRALAAFHLDKLVREGLLEASYRRLTKRRGPGAGRPAKLYRRSARQFALSLPPREYELAARLFADVLATAEFGRALARVQRAAQDLGRRLGAAARLARGPSGPTALRTFLSALQQHGYEPSRHSSGTISLRNCPFDTLARSHRPLACGMNRALLTGLKQGVALGGYRVTPTRQPGMCCVMLRPVRAGRSREA